jgi:hypothetical protein
MAMSINSSSSIHPSSNHPIPPCYGEFQEKVCFHLRTNVAYKCNSTLDLQIGSSVLLHFSANIWYFGESRTVRHVQYATFVRRCKRTLKVGSEKASDVIVFFEWLTMPLRVRFHVSVCTALCWKANNTWKYECATEWPDA